MKTKTLALEVTAVVLTLAMCLSCSSSGADNDLQVRLAGIEEEMQLTQQALTDCQLALDEWNSELETLQAGVTELRAGHPGLALLTVELTPNPVLPNAEGRWMWRVTVSSGPVGIRLLEVVRKVYWNGGLKNERLETDMASLFHRLGGGYLPAYQTDYFNGGFPVQGLDALGIVVSGIDDNGSLIRTDEVRVKLMQPLMLEEETSEEPTLDYVELKYDDGESNGSRAFGTGPMGHGHAVRFTPTTIPFTVDRVRICGQTYGDGCSERYVEVQLRDYDFNLLDSSRCSHAAFGPTQSWVTVEMNGVAVLDDFYIVVITDSPKECGVRVSYDSDSENLHSEYVHGGVLAEWSIDLPKARVNWMIRCASDLEPA